MSDCFDKAVALLARRSHFTAQLAAKLRRRGFAEDEVAATLERLAELGYLDDRRTARELVEERLARGPEGRRRLAAELERRGAPADVAAEVLAARLDDDDLPMARQAAARWRRSRRGGDPRALARHLERKGFTTRSILAVVEEVGTEATEEPEDG